MESLAEDMHQASTPKKQRLSRMSSQEEMMVKMKPADSEGKRRLPRPDCYDSPAGVHGRCVLALVCPSKRWCHTMCLSDPDTAILIGGETADQTYCKDSLWKLELGL